MEPLSVLISTLNEEENLPACLESCAFADEIVVVDSGSRDRTREIAERAGARVLERPFDDHASQKNWGLERVQHSWVLVLDADERVTEPLRDEIRELLASGSRRTGYWIRRRNQETVEQSTVDSAKEEKPTFSNMPRIVDVMVQPDTMPKQINAIESGTFPRTINIVFKNQKGEVKSKFQVNCLQF